MFGLSFEASGVTHPGGRTLIRLSADMRSVQVCIHLFTAPPSKLTGSHRFSTSHLAYSSSPLSQPVSPDSVHMALNLQPTDISKPLRIWWMNGHQQCGGVTRKLSNLPTTQVRQFSGAFQRRSSMLYAIGTSNKPLPPIRMNSWYAGNVTCM